ncbi:M1 family metallopeptidase [Salinibacter grassmerensis]|uniref:M1 family metallopeptidase n=1 Tax=Salinibacter grassmerensis TaxID=3040353 RepID=UPI0021E8C126|nr:M1 family metallopeptidase [Salinibacter grassmerensis]
MRARLSVLLLFLLCSPALALAQSPSHWQQHVDYEMDIRLNPETHQVDGRQRLTYTNNSPDTLRTVYYHLYFNAFQPQSMMAERNRHLPDPDGRTVPRIFNLTPDEQGRQTVESLTQDGTPVSYEVNDTVLRVDLAAPIPPGTSTTFVMDYRSQVPLQTRRSGRDSRGDDIDYTMTQWYPKMAEYDERGWHANYYVNREYYAPYGEFDVEITLPAEYTIGATGVLQNPEEVGHGYDIDGNGSWRPSDGLPETDTLTWHFRAEDVHNFAWSADPDYIHDKVTADGTTHHILYKPGVAEQWRPLRTNMPDITAFFSDEYGDYPYPQMTVAQGGDGGMEYPMFTVVSSYDGPEFEAKSSYRSILGTTVHEFAHMWYYSALGSNEADYAWMDEGFTSYATTEGMAHLAGRPANHTGARQSVVTMQKLGIAEPFSTPADWFSTNAAYGITSYPGGQMLVDMMGYVIGDAQRDQWLRRYFRERGGMHPDPFDLELFAEQESGLMLDWYFQQVTESTRTVDDAIVGLSQERAGDSVAVDLTLERKGSLRLPQDVKLTLADGSTQWLNVPLASMHGHKPVPDDWIVTEPWPWVALEKTVSVTVDSRVEKAVVDPNGETPDVNRLNNSTTLPLRTHVLRAPQPSWSHYELGVRPLAGYAHDFGFGGGVQVRGQYFRGERRLRGTVTLWPEVLFSGGDEPTLQNSDLPRPGPFLPSDNGTGTWFDGLDYEFRYEHPVDPFGARATVELSAAKHLGVFENRLSLRLPLSSPLADQSERLRLSAVHQLNLSDRAFGLSRTPYNEVRDPSGNVLGTRDQIFNPWGQSQALFAQLNYTRARDGNRISAVTELGGTLRAFDSDTSPAGSFDQASRIGLTAQKTAELGLFTGRANLQFGLGASNLLPHKQFVLGGQSLENQWRSDTYRQASAAFEQPVSDAHLVGFGSSGPVAYLRAANGRLGLSGENITAGRLSLGGTPFPTVNALSPLRLSAFSGIGTTWNEGAFLSGFAADDLKADAGIGARYSISEIPHLDRWTAQSDFLQGLDVVAKFPLWASDPGLIEGSTGEFDFRWLIGIEL